MNEHIGRKLHRFRMRRGWSKRKLAIELGVSIPTIMRWENGYSDGDRCVPADYNLYKIRELLGDEECEDA